MTPYLRLSNNYLSLLLKIPTQHLLSQIHVLSNHSNYNLPNQALSFNIHQFVMNKKIILKINRHTHQLTYYSGPPTNRYKMLRNYNVEMLYFNTYQELHFGTIFNQAGTQRGNGQNQFCKLHCINKSKDFDPCSVFCKNKF